MANADEDVFKILLATDCHLGYMENDGVRGSDSITTFEEILKIAVDKKVDFILLGGDLFHENKPSRKIMHDCIALMRKYCMGDKPVEFEFLSDQSENFKHCSIPVVNFEDPNLNISIPVFSIHGNHDDPAGLGSYCSLDLLSATGLINYFGKCLDLDNVVVSPLMFQKGKTKLSIYGMGSIRDERLHRTFLDGKVSMLRPKEKSDDWFNLMVVHQNRTKHGPKNYLPEQFLDNFLDLVVWGHEHECRIEKEYNAQQEFFITQPGSSVATSLCHGEAVPKHVGLLQIRKKEFQITKIPLQTVRQFYIKDVDLEETSLNLDDPDSVDKVIEYCNELVEQFLEKAADEHTGHPKQPMLPLIRLRIFCPSNFETFSVHRFGHPFVTKVANTKDIILFSRKKAAKLKTAELDSEMLKNLLKQEGVDKQRVEDLVKKYFAQTDEDKRLLLLSEIGVGGAIQEFVDKEVKEAISTIFYHQVKKTRTHLKEKATDHTIIEEEITKFREERRGNAQAERNEFQDVMRRRPKTSSSNISDDDDIILDDDIDISKPSTSSRGGRGRGGRGRARGGRGSRGGRGASNNTSTASTSRRNTSRSTANNDTGTKRKGRQADLSRFLNARNNEDEVEISDDDDVQVAPKRRKVANQTKSRKGVCYTISDSD